jgi:hypothetical protein
MKNVLAAFFAVLTLSTSPATAQVGGNLAAGPPVELELTISETAEGKPQISATEFKLITGEYYRLNVTSSGKTDWRLELPDLLQNSHLRVVTVNGVEIHLQSMVFRAIEFDEPNKASFTFTPIRPGIYKYTIGRNPIAQGLPAGQAGIQETDRRAEGRFIVE